MRAFDGKRFLERDQLKMPAMHRNERHFSGNVFVPSSSRAMHALFRIIGGADSAGPVGCCSGDDGDGSGSTLVRVAARRGDDARGYYEVARCGRSLTLSP